VWCHNKSGDPVTVYYTFFGINKETGKLAYQESMQFRKAIERLTMVIVYSDPVLGPYMLYKIDVSDGFYQSAESLCLHWDPSS
jgi:hypothetical protein